MIWINLEYKEHFKICSKNPLNNNTIKNNRKSYKIRINTSKINNNCLRNNYNSVILKDINSSDKSNNNKNNNSNNKICNTSNMNNNKNNNNNIQINTNKLFH